MSKYSHYYTLKNAEKMQDVPQISNRAHRAIADSEDLSPDLEAEADAAIRAACKALRKRSPRDPVGYTPAPVEICCVDTTKGFERVFRKGGNRA